ncbi:MAG: PrsW family intramembrane metalloprotease [Spirochaetales bacterium]|jgi:RsiW-degrading membrane proteinase PrsW (M82 family)|nr:PrsW family intramembrane metalloprotease [Spirochaetales bacterium]
MMPILVYSLAFAAFGSAGGLVFLLWKKDSASPAGLVLTGFALGFASALPAWLVERFLLSYVRGGGTGRQLFTAFCAAGLVEETFKLLALKAACARKDFRGAGGAVSCAAAVGFGFAFLENIFYTFGGPWVLLLRAFSSVPLHAAAAVFTGYGFGLSRFSYKPVLLWGFAAAVLLHGAYDFFLMKGSGYGYISLALLAAALYAAFCVFRAAQKLDANEGRIGRR